MVAVVIYLDRRRSGGRRGRLSMHILMRARSEWMVCCVVFRKRVGWRREGGGEGEEGKSRLK